MDRETVLGIARHILTTLGGVLITKGYVDSGATEAIIGGLIAAAGVVWSAIQKRQQAKALAAASTPSA